MQVALLDVAGTLTFPVAVVRALLDGPTAAFNQAYAWLLANGSLFKLASLLAKVFWIAAIYYAHPRVASDVPAAAAGRIVALAQADRAGVG